MTQNSAPTVAELSHVLWKPTLYRGVVVIAYALVGIFWVQDPPAAALSVSLGIMFLLQALLLWPVTRLTGLPETMRTGITSTALAALVAGVMALFFREAAPLSFVAAFGFALAGGSELFTGIKLRALGRPLRDEIISGAVLVIGAVLMAMAASADVHAVFGMSSMILVVLGVHLVIAALGYRHDARAEAA